MKSFQFGLIFILLSLVGCGSDGRSSDIYYIQEKDVYLRILDDGEVVKYKCSVNHGYQEDIAFNGKFDSHQIEVLWNERVYSYQLEAGENDSEFVLSEGLNVVDAFSGASGPIASPDRFLLLKKEDIPTACTNSAVDIISISPENWDADLNNSFAVNFDYRGQVESDLTLQLAYSYANPYVYDMSVFGSTLDIDGLAHSNATLRIDVRSDHSSEDLIDIYVLMYEAGSHINNLTSYGRLNLGSSNLSFDPAAWLNSKCLTCLNTESSIGIGPFD